MSTRGGGRGVGRGAGRGRSRGTGVTDSRRPGETPQGPPQGTQQQVGRGRGRASAQLQQPKQQSPPESVPPTEEMAKLSVQDTKTQQKPGAKREDRRRGAAEEEEMLTRPEHIHDKSGKHGHSIRLMTNHVVLKNRPGKAIYQYNVSYNPPIDSKGLRVGLLRVHEDALKLQKRIFDGMVLYLPHRLPNTVTEVVSQTKEGENVRITVKLTNELSANSPVCLQLFNVLFRKYVIHFISILLKQVNLIHVCV